MMLHRLFLLLLLQTGIYDADAQDFSITHYDERNGLTADVIYGITQDKKGFTWLATENGVFRFDGTGFKKYSVDDGLTDNVNLGMQTDSSNHIFFEPFSANPCYFFNGEFYNAATDTVMQKMETKGIIHYFYHKETDQFVSLLLGGSYFRLLRFRGDRLVTERVNLPANLQILCMVPYGMNMIILANSKDSLYYHLYNGSKLVHSQFLFLLQGWQGRTSSIYKDGLLYIALEKTIYTCKRLPGLGFAVLGTKQYPRTLKNLFPATDGFWATSYQSGTYLFEKNEPPLTLLPDAIVNYVYEDRDHNTWMGTDGKGLFLLKKNKVKNLSENVGNNHRRAVSIVSDQQGNIFCGYDNMTLSRYANGKHTWYFLSESGKPEDGFVTRMGFRNTREMLLCTSKDLLLLNIHTKEVKRIWSNGQRMGNIKSLFIESDSIFYAGTSATLLRLRLEKQAKTTDTLFKERTISVHIDAEKNIWMGTLTGLHVRYAGKAGFERSNNEILSRVKVNAIISQNGFGYFATDRGIIISNGVHTTIVNKENGLTDENCKRLYLYENSVYAATSSGVFRIELVNDNTVGKVIQCSQWDGLSSDNINDIYVHNDTVWAATNKGLNVFTWNDIVRAPEPGISIMELTTHKRNYPVYYPQVLSAGENDVTISYAGISFYNRGGLYFEYRLLNQSNIWIRTSNTSVTFNGLQPGSYTFEIKAFNAQGIPGKTVERIEFRIKPFFWQTMLFRVLVFFGIACLAIWLLRKREQQIRKKQKRQAEYDNKVSELELEAIKAQINPHFIYNCLNAIQNSILKNNMEESHRQLSMFSKLVRTTLDLSKLNFITLAAEMAYLDMYLQLEKMRFRDKLQFTIKAAENIPVHEIEIPVMLLQPFVENAVKHGLKINETSYSEVKVNFNLVDGVLVCAIEDSGAGIKTEAGTVNGNETHHSLGISISSGRADTYNKLFHSDIGIRFINKKETDLAKTGTIVLIQIPLK
jgi:ligand-binding sensor domain-containing protein